MAIRQKSRKTTKSKEESFGLLACGASGAWQVDVDETTSGRNRWWAQIEGPLSSFYFELPSLDVIGKMAMFLCKQSASAKHCTNGQSKRLETLILSKDKKTPICLVRDDEFNDRFFLVVGPMDKSTVRFVIAGKDALHISEALQQVQEDLEAVL